MAYYFICYFTLCGLSSQIFFYHNINVKVVYLRRLVLLFENSATKTQEVFMRSFNVALIFFALTFVFAIANANAKPQGRNFGMNSAHMSMHSGGHSSSPFSGVRHQGSHNQGIRTGGFHQTNHTQSTHLGGSHQKTQVHGQNAYFSGSRQTSHTRHQ